MRQQLTHNILIWGKVFYNLINQREGDFVISKLVLWPLNISSFHLITRIFNSNGLINMIENCANKWRWYFFYRCTAFLYVLFILIDKEDCCIITMEGTETCSEAMSRLAVGEVERLPRSKGETRGQKTSGLTHECGVFGCIAAGDWPSTIDVGQVVCLGMQNL